MASNYDNTSNTTAQTVISVDQMINFAFSEAGRLPEEMTPENVNRARQAFWYILINLSNRGVNLWLLDYLVIGSKTQTRQYEMPVGTVDIREANYRLMTRPSTTSDNVYGAFNTVSLDLEYTIAAGASAEAFYEDGYRFLSAGFYCDTVGTTMNVEYSYDGITWAPMVTVTNGIVNQWGYTQIDGSPLAKWWRFRNPSNAQVKIRAFSLASVQQDIPLARLNRDSYFNLPNKDFLGERSLQYWFDRQVTPIMNVWPVPQDAFQAFMILIEMQPQDVGKLTNEIAVPDRWMPAMQAQLSHRVAKLLPGVDINRITMLKNDAIEATITAENEDRDKSPQYITPNISYYTR
jgi:hypothetical protein